MINFFIQIASFVASLVAMYSTSVTESAMVGCFILFQLTAPPYRVKTYYDVDLLSSGSD